MKSVYHRVVGLHDWFHIYLSMTTPIIQTSSSSLSTAYLMKSREDTADDSVVEWIKEIIVKIVIMIILIIVVVVVLRLEKMRSILKLQVY